MCQGDPNCTCNLISEVRAQRDQELLKKKYARACVEDDENTRVARDDYARNPSFENAMALGNALAFQMRYHEAIECFKRAVEIDPSSYIARRKLAGRYLTTLQLDEAENGYEWCIEHAQDLLDPLYMYGLVKYYRGDFESAKDYFCKAYELATNDVDMSVASLFWAVACDVQLYREPTHLKFFDKSVTVGHHTGYYYALRLFAGDDFAECDVIDTQDELQYSIFTFGVHLFYKHKDNTFLSDVFLSSTLKMDKYFSSFAYLAAYLEYKKIA